MSGRRQQQAGRWSLKITSPAFSCPCPQVLARIAGGTSWGKVGADGRAAARTGWESLRRLLDAGAGRGTVK